MENERQKTILKTMKAQEIVTGEEKKSTATPPAHSTRARSGEADNANLQLAIESFKKRRNEAEVLLRFSVNGKLSIPILIDSPTLERAKR
jgi:uncharacterized FlaG/YvyC family protein